MIVEQAIVTQDHFVIAMGARDIAFQSEFVTGECIDLFERYIVPTRFTSEFLVFDLTIFVEVNAVTARQTSHHYPEMIFRSHIFKPSLSCCDTI